jgi:hypothetical protein
MKKLIFVLLISVAGLFACSDDWFAHCPNATWCDAHDFCCPTNYSYACCGRCYTDPVSAWNACGHLGYSIEQCNVE